MFSFGLLAEFGELLPWRITLLGVNTVPEGMPSISFASFNFLEFTAPTFEETTIPSFTFVESFKIILFKCSVENNSGV